MLSLSVREAAVCAGFVGFRHEELPVWAL